MISPVSLTQEGLYALVNEGSNELSLVPGTPPSFLSCSRQGGLPGCLFMFDQVDQQCADGRTGERSTFVYMYGCVCAFACVWMCMYMCMCIIVYNNFSLSLY